ncbi:MAG TPA: potassium/proton antiporter [Longimicrobiales bacterium]|nr:potassium/proton antiporter [Longimicrobiales bacterium]
MFQVDGLILVGAVLVLFAVASSKFSARLGVPVLVVFIGLGMLAGSEGLGGIEFENYVLANGIGTIALALILFDGGLRTSLGALRVAWKPALALATLGVLLTSLVTGYAAAWVLGIPLLEGMLLGSIVGSTDAAAVFSVLRSRGARLSERLASTLEVESGSNDPMAIFLTVGLLEILLGRMDPGWPLLGFFALQMSVGGAAGLVVGRLGVEANNRINLDAAGLYPVMMAAVGFLAYGLAASLGGSGFLAVYVAGIVLGNSRIVFQRGIFLFTDGMAWLAQIVMFTMLGLLVFPSRVLQIAPEGLAISAVLILVGRPVATAMLLPFFRFTAREITLVAWVGLRGAVPIILATYPLLMGLPDGRLLFNIVFFVVLVSAVTQGWSLPRVAAALGLDRAAEPEPPVTLEITSLRHIPGDIVDYLVVERAKAAGRLIRDLSLPDGAVVAMVTRGQEIIPPRGSMRLLPLDHVFFVLRPEVRQLVDRLFAPLGEEPEEPLPPVEFPLSARTRIRELVEFYGIDVDAAPESTLGELLQARLGSDALTVGSTVDLGSVRLRVREVSTDGVEVVGLQVLA